MLVIAMFMALLKFNGNTTIFKSILNGFIKIENIITVAMLKKRLKCASFFESFSAFRIPQNESNVVPIFAPKMKGIAWYKDKKFDNERTCNSAIKTLDD